jgi:hypothetical protein
MRIAEVIGNITLSRVHPSMMERAGLLAFLIVCPHCETMSLPMARMS